MIGIHEVVVDAKTSAQIDAYLSEGINVLYIKVFCTSKGLRYMIEPFEPCPSLNALCDPKYVIVVPNGGWSSYTFVMSNLERLIGRRFTFSINRQQKNGKEVYVQYYGDSDPSGERMTAEDSKLVKKLEEHHINFELP